MVNYFIGKTQDELEELLAQAQHDLALGRAVIQAGAGDTFTHERVEVDVYKRIELILGALNALDPVKYPTASIRRVTRTRLTVWPCDVTFNS